MLQSPDPPVSQPFPHTPFSESALTCLCLCVSLFMSLSLLTQPSESANFKPGFSLK